jgi:dipeptidyl-peptidase-3
VTRSTKWSALAGELTTNMHEVIGHASGKVSDKVKGKPETLLKEQFSALEEARADLVALYFLPDPKLAELGLLRKEDQADIVLAEYEGYARRALDQLRRVRQGTQIEEDHMRNRQMIVRWLIANTKAIDVRTRDNKPITSSLTPRLTAKRVGRLRRSARIKAEGTIPPRRHALRDPRRTSIRSCATRSWRAWTSHAFIRGFVMPYLVIKDAGRATPT